MIKLGDVLEVAVDAAPVDPAKSYPIAGVYSFGRGLLARAPLSGAETTYKVFHRLHEGDFVLSQLKAWEGALAKVPPAFDGWFVSPQFPTFRPISGKLDISYLDWYCKQPKVWESLRGRARGMGARRDSVSPKAFLSLTLPLPLLQEQRRIVARIEELATKMDEARSLKRQIEGQARRLLLGVFYDQIKGADRRPMKEVAPIIRRSVTVDPDGSYPELGVRSFGKGTFHKPALSGIIVGSKRLYRIEPGDLIFNNVFAWEGAVAVAGPDDAGRFGSHRFITCVVKDGVVTARFLYFYFLTDEGLRQLGEASPGGAGRNRTLGLDALEEIAVPVPPYERQLWFDDLQGKVEIALQLQAETATELDALLPSILDRAFSGSL